MRETVAQCGASGALARRNAAEFHRQASGIQFNLRLAYFADKISI